MGVQRPLPRRGANLGNVSESCLHQASTRFYKETIELLEGIWQEERYNSTVSIATLGSKMQHVATGMYCRMHKETCLWLSEPLEFTTGQYSSGVGSLWALDLGAAPDLARLLDSYGEYVWQMPGA